MVQKEMKIEAEEKDEGRNEGREEEGMKRMKMAAEGDGENCR